MAEKRSKYFRALEHLQSSGINLDYQFDAGNAIVTQDGKDSGIKLIDMRISNERLNQHLPSKQNSFKVTGFEPK